MGVLRRISPGLTVHRSLAFLIPGDLDSRTGGYGYDRRVAGELRALGWDVEVHRLDDSYPEPTAEARRHTATVLTRLPDHQLTLVDGLAFGAMAEEAEAEQNRLRLVALVHHPLALETGLDPERAHGLEHSERRALACARLTFVTSRATVRSLGPYGVSGDRVLVVEPGTDPGPLAEGSTDNSVHLLCVASVTPRKGYETLVQALAALKDLPWRLTCVGSLERAPDTAARVHHLVESAGLSERVVFRGELGEGDVAECYATADLFVLPTFHEGYGMVVAEAIARGIPVISTATGAIPDLVGDDAGLLVPAADVDALATALRRAMTDGALRQQLKEGARRRRETLPSWRDAATRMAAALASLPE